MGGGRGWIKNRVIWLLVGMGLFLWQMRGWLFETVLAAPTELFFSEYIEGSGNNRALEIFNGTAVAVDLSGYTVELYSGGNLTPSQVVVLSGVVLSQDVFVVARSGADGAILAVADLVDDTITGFNGDDAVVLRKGGLVIDAIGQVGVDPGIGWGDPPDSTQNQTLRRKVGVEAGDTNPDDPFDPGLEWDSFPLDSFEDLGQHELPEPTPTPTPLPPLAVVINEVAWGGTAASTADEWIELHNTTGEAIDLTGWVITSTNGLSLTLVGVIEANGFYLIERTDDNTISDISADLTASFGGGLANGGDSLFLSAAGMVMDTANADGGAWPNGSGSPTYQSMERANALEVDSDGAWQGNDMAIRNGLDADGAPLNGTPRQANSSGLLPATATPTSTATSPAETLTPTSTSTPTPLPGTPLPPLAVIINEVAWSGAAASTADEWIELYNTTSQPIDLTGWVITSTSGLNIPLAGIIEANGFYLVERTDDNTVSDILADLTISFGGGLLNGGDTLFLSMAGEVIDTANSDGGSWPGGSSSPDYLSMERIDPLAPDTEANWQSNDTVTRNGQDAAGTPLNGTPRQANSSGVLPPTSTSTPTPTPTPTSISGLTPTPSPTPILPLAVVINEVAWGGTSASTADEWIELHNTTSQTIDLNGWVITSTGGLTIPLVGTIEANGFYLIERTDDSTISDVSADLAVSFGAVLANGGDSLFLSLGGLVIDTANGDGATWPGGGGSPDYLTMERTDPLASDTDTNWQSNDTVIRNGQDANGVSLNGTPRQANSTGVLPPTSTPTPTATATPTLPAGTGTPASTPTPAPTLFPPLAVVINEVAWGGTAASTADEWLELYNTTGQVIDLSGWVITSTNGLNISLVGVIEANGFYLIERTDDNTISDIDADLVASFGGGLANGGGSLFLAVAGIVVDTVNIDGGGWPGGSGSPTYRSMERLNPLGVDSDGNWQGNDTVIRNGQDANGAPLNGTPRQANSSGVLPATPTPTATLTATPTSTAQTPTLTPTPILVPPLAVVINEVAWSGTTASTADEWLELRNTTDQAIDLSGWVITSTSGLNIPLVGIIEANGFYLIERTDDNTVSDVSADLAVSFGGVLANGGDRLFLSVGGWVIDTANGDGGPWPAGSSAPDYLSMERIDPLSPDTDSNWQNNGTTIRNGQDAGGAPLNGTPGQANSDGTLPPTPTPTLTPTLTPTATTPTPSPTPVAPLTVVINEIAWGGTVASSTDEWLELHNTSSQTVDLRGWVITSSNGLNISLSGIIEANGFYLIERSDDNPVSDIHADLVTSFGGALTNGGDSLFLSVEGVVIDTANGAGGAWPGGSGSPGYLSMERIEPLAADTELNWRSNDTVTRNGQDANGLPLNGTPRQANSRGDVPPTPTPTPTQPPLPPLAVVINEVAWSATGASSADEWLELLNTTTATLRLDGWLITSTNGMKIPLDGTTIEAGAYYLIERTDDLVVSDIDADLVISFGSGLPNSGGRLFLSAGGALIDTVNLDGGSWPAGTAAPHYFSMERVEPLLVEVDTHWKSNDGIIRNGLDAEGQPINGTPKQPNSPPPPPPGPAAPILIGEFLYDGLTPSTEGDEFIELCNPNAEAVNLTGYKVGDEEIKSEGEGMYLLPEGLMLASETCLTLARNGEAFQARFGTPPDLQVSDLKKYTTWGRGSWSLSNGGDELLVLGPEDQVFDSVAYGEGNYEVLGLEAEMIAPAPFSLQRVWPIDTHSMRHDFVRDEPTPGSLTRLPGPPSTLTSPAALPGGMYAYWGQLQAHTSYGEGAGPPYYALAQARAAGLHFYGITDEGAALSESRWQRSLSQAEAATVPGQFVALQGVEWSQPEMGRLTIFNERTLLQSSQAAFDTLPELYAWLAGKPEALVQFQSPGSGGDLTEFVFNLAVRAGIALQEVGVLGDEYLNHEPTFVQSNMKGWRVAPAINHHSYEARWGLPLEIRTGIIAPALTKSSVVEALRARRVFATEDADLALGMRLNGAWMGSVLPVSGAASLRVDWVEPEPEPVTLFLYDGNLLLARVPLDGSQGHWQTILQLLPGHFYWIKLVQADGDRAYSAPIWVEGQAPEERLVINEILPAPNEVDWDGNGQVDHLDEWVEIFNPLDRAIGLGGWRLRDASGRGYTLPLGLSIPARGFVTLYYRHTEIGLNNGKETVDLIRPDGQLADSFAYTRSPGYDESWCRLPDGRPEWSDDCEPSPDAPNRARRGAEPLEVSIYEAKRLTVGAWVKVKGQVTAPPGIFGARTMYIQDETAGIMIYLPRDHRLEVKLGDKIALEGNLRFYQEEAEIAVSKRQRIDFLGPGTPFHPLPLETTMMLEPFEGMLVMLQGQAVRFQGRTTFWVDDGTDPAKVYVRTSTGIKKSFIKPGTPVTVVGIVSQYSDKTPSRADYRLMPRFQTDLGFPEVIPSPKVEKPTLLPETGYQ